MSSPPKLGNEPISSWQYVAEGGANLVVAYRGEKSPFTGKVLRLRKVLHNPSLPLQVDYTAEDASVAFTDRVVIPLLPPAGTPRLESLPVPHSSWLSEMHDHIEPSRPENRRLKDGIDTKRKWVVLAEDLVNSSIPGTSQLSIEIKPKWGFMPNHDYLSSKSLPIKTHLCRFCLHRIYRQQSGDEHHSQANNYCPMDLYGHSEVSVRRAVTALLDSWKESDGKGNNLKLFLDGKMLRPSEIPQEQTDQLLSQESTSLTSTLMAFLTKPAHENLLVSLAGLQQALDLYDIEGITSRLQTVPRHPDNYSTGIDILTADVTNVVKYAGGEVSIAEYEDFVRREGDAIRNRQMTYRNLNQRDAILAYLLSATFKDCSMIIRMDLPNGGLNAFANIRASLVDCDIKSVDRLQRYAQLDRDIVQAVNKATEDFPNLLQSPRCGIRG